MAMTIHPDFRARALRGAVAAALAQAVGVALLVGGVIAGRGALPWLIVSGLCFLAAFLIDARAVRRYRRASTLIDRVPPLPALIRLTGEEAAPMAQVRFVDPATGHRTLTFRLEGAHAPAALSGQVYVPRNLYDPVVLFFEDHYWCSAGWNRTEKPAA